MKMHRHNRQHYVRAEMNVVPYIDVMLVLLVIFMIAAPLINQAVKIDLPDANAEVFELPKDIDQPLILSVDENGNFYLNYAPEPHKNIGKEEIIALAHAVLARQPHIPVLVRGDEKASYAFVFAAIEILRASGATQVGLSTELPEQEL